MPTIEELGREVKALRSRLEEHLVDNAPRTHLLGLLAAALYDLISCEARKAREPKFEVGTFVQHAESPFPKGAWVTANDLYESLVKVREAGEQHDMWVWESELVRARITVAVTELEEG